MSALDLGLYTIGAGVFLLLGFSAAEALVMLGVSITINAWIDA